MKKATIIIEFDDTLLDESALNRFANILDELSNDFKKGLTPITIKKSIDTICHISYSYAETKSYEN